MARLDGHYSSGRAYVDYWEEIFKEAKEVSDSKLAIIASRNIENAKSFGDHLRSILQGYQIAYIELDQELELDKVCDIFTQINSRGSDLTSLTGTSATH